MVVDTGSKFNFPIFVSTTPHSYMYEYYVGAIRAAAAAATNCLLCEKEQQHHKFGHLGPPFRFDDSVEAFGEHVSREDAAITA